MSTGTPTAAPDTAPPSTSPSAPARGHAPHRVGGPRHWWDWILAADPGLNHLQAGWRALIAMVTGLAVGYGMAHALDVPPMIGMTMGGMMGLMSSFAVAEKTPLRLTGAMLYMPFPFGAAFALGSWLQNDRVLELVLLGALLTLTFVMVRWGPLGLLTGMMLFNAVMNSLIAPVPLAMCDEVFYTSFVACAGILVARLLLAYPMPREDLLRTQRAFVVEARRVVDAAATALDPDARHDAVIKRMRRAQRRLNFTTLTIDGNLAQPAAAADPEAAELLHQYLFDAELALSGIGRAVQELTGRHIPSQLREALVVGLTITRDTHLGRAGALHPVAEMVRRAADDAPADMSEDEAEVRALGRRIAALLDDLADSLAYWLDIGWKSPKRGVKVPFQPTVALERGVPAGSGPAARKLIGQKGGSGWRKAVPVLRAPLQVAIGSAIVIPIADLINGHRFYWGLIGLMIVSFGTNTTHERVRKFAHRVVGTVAGAVVGIVLVHLLAHIGGQAHVYWMLAVVVAAVAIGSWGMQRQYAYWVTGLVVALCQMYALTTPQNGMDRLLVDRLLENSLGFAVGIVVAALVVPVSTRKVAREAKRTYLAAVQGLVEQIAQRWQDPEAPIRLRGAARKVDAALYQVESVERPLVRMPMGVRGRGSDAILALLGTATRHANALAAAADIDIDLAPQLRERVERITEVLTGSLTELDGNVAGRRGGTWTRVSPMIRDLERALHAPAGPRADSLYTALRELAALDEVLAALSDNRGMTVATVTPEAAKPLAAPAPAPDPAPGAVPAPREQVSPEQVAALRAEAFRTAGGQRPAAPAASGPSTGEMRALRDAWARSGGAGDTLADAVLGSRSVRPAAPEPAPAAAAPADPRIGASVQGTVSCGRHPNGCDAWITVVNDHGKRRAGVKTAAGAYRIADLPPGTYTLIASSGAHTPSAEFLVVRGADQRHDIHLTPVD